MQPLLEIWEEISSTLRASALGELRPEIAEPELHVYGGFPRWLEANHGGERWYRPWRDHMEKLLSQRGVVNHGGVNQSRIARAYADASFYVFPSDKPETSGVNLMKAQV